jgi:signal transduction histidine kinase
VRSGVPARPFSYSPERMSASIRKGQTEMIVTDNKQERKDLEELTLSYQQAIHFITHELKNAATAIGGFALRLIKTEADPERRSQLEMIYEQTQFLETVSMRFLLASQLMKGGFPLYKEQISDLYGEVMEPVIRILAKDAPDLFRESEERLIEGGPIKLTGDKNLLRIVFQNLLGNALKYRYPGGRISLEVQKQGRSYQFTVWNEGPGVEADEVHKIFDKFYRARHRHSQEKEGTGLGLYNTRSIIEAHGGRIWCTTEPGQWIKFVFTLPQE